MLEEIRKSYIHFAKAVPQWRIMNKNDLINACIDHENNPYLYNAYFSAVVLRYWGNIGKYYLASKRSGFTPEDCYWWLVEAITYILKARKWRDPNNPLSLDKNAPDKCINRSIYSTRQRHYYLANRLKRRVNYGKVSLDNIYEDLNGNDRIFCDPNQTFDDVDIKLGFVSLLNFYLKNNFPLTALVLWILGTGNINKVSTIKNNFPQFKLSKLANSVMNFSEDDLCNANIFIRLNNEDKSQLLACCKNLKCLSKNKLMSVLENTMKKLRGDKNLREYLELCC